ncbi:hypothetical protein RJ639_019435 [Escallonia herrerae]|uniref:Hyccin n=1 Tax=Escallonia herrerae TaxID=1293975 RepID=A0AA88V6Z5_9ASTE|nr:hypothetical protein RJ639_019435 [Escallonia herrerae]
MSFDTTVDSTTTTTTEPATPTPTSPHISWSDSFSEAQTAIKTLSTILPSVSSSLTSSDNPSSALLHDAETSAEISRLLRHPDSGAGGDHLCRWLYDTFQSAKADLQLVVLRFLPLIAGLYLSRVPLRKPLAGFEAVLLAIYAHETVSRNGQAVTVTIPDLSHSSIYHETKLNTKNNATELNLTVISPSLEPHGTVRSTRRARIVGVALELYYSKISQMPSESKIDFCEFCTLWAGQDGDAYQNDPDDEVVKSGEAKENCEGENVGAREGRIPLPWELLQPVLRILGHCLMGYKKNNELYEAACGACRSLYARSLHDINPKAILATRSLLRLVKMEASSEDKVDHTEIVMSDVINL